MNEDDGETNGPEALVRTSSAQWIFGTNKKFLHKYIPVVHAKRASDLTGAVNGPSSACMDFWSVQWGGGPPPKISLFYVFYTDPPC